MKIPVNKPVISDDAKKNVTKALQSGWLSSSGPFVKEFENAFARYLGTKHAVTTTSGTTALHLALLALGVGEGDEVIVPAFVMGAVFMAVLYTGAKPVFVDCELDTFNISPDKIEKKITNKTKALIVVHTYGHPADMDPILALAEKHKICTIEDAAEAHGAEYKGKLCGTMGDIGCFSFYANKIITTGEGGMVVTNNNSRAEEMERLKDLYHSKGKRFIHDKVGYNYRMSNIQAAIGLGELANINKYISRKRWMADRYNEALTGIDGIRLPVEKNYAKSVYWMYAIVIDPKISGHTKDELKNFLANEDIETRDFFYPPERQPMLRHFVGDQKFKNSEYLSKNGLYLPSGLALNESEIETVSKTIKKYFGKV